MSRGYSHPRVLACLGFSLLEVLVALIVLSVGLLGIAKMEALALSSTAVSTRRALAALEADSLADSMHVNKGYWGAAAGLTFTVSGTTVTTLPAPYQDCAAAGPCNSAQLASYDLSAWATQLQALLPSDQATIACNGNTPIECQITISWSEQAVGLNATQAASGVGSAITNVNYVLYVEP
ncbi:MAG: type IV pilus modification protein PilV [Steroidobacteraceae bacterium]